MVAGVVLIIVVLQTVMVFKLRLMVDRVVLMVVMTVVMMVIIIGIITFFVFMIRQELGGAPVGWSDVVSKAGGGWREGAGGGAAAAAAGSCNMMNGGLRVELGG